MAVRSWVAPIHLRRQGQMARESHPHARRARRFQRDASALDDLCRAGDLAADADLHVVDHQRHAARIAPLRQAGRDLDAFA